MDLDVGAATVLAIVVFALLIALANRFNAREIGRTSRAHGLALLRLDLSDVAAEGDRYRVREQGVIAYVTLGAAQARGTAIGIECDVPLGRLAAFDARGDEVAAVLTRHGTSGAPLDEVEDAMGKGILQGVRVSCDGRRVRLEASALALFGALVRLAVHVGRSGARALTQLPGAWSSSVDSATRSCDGTAVTLRIDGGLRIGREGVVVPREVRDSEMPIADAIARLAGHARAAELRALAEGIDGTLTASTDRIAVLLATGAPLETIESAARLVARLEDPAPGDAAYR